MSLHAGGFHYGPCQRPSGVRGGLMDLHIRFVQLGLQKPFKDKHIKVSVGRRVCRRTQPRGGIPSGKKDLKACRKQEMSKSRYHGNLGVD